MALGVFGPALFLARLLGPLDIAAHLGFEIPGHQLLLGRIAAEVFVLFHIDAVIGQMAGRQGAGRLAAQAAGDGVVGDGFRGIEDQIGLGEDLFGGRGGLLFLFALGAVALFVVGMSLTLMIKGHHIDSEISTNKNMQRLGIRCAVQESREDSGQTDCADAGCSGNCSACDIEQTTKKEE